MQTARRIALSCRALLPALLVSAGAATASAAIGAQIGHWTDYSGTVDVKVFRCAPVYGEAPASSCSVPADYAIVGGGAETCAVNPGAGPCPNLKGQPGALLTSSYPSDAGTWTASSKDHDYVFFHFLRTYAIGMKLIGPGPVDLRSQLRIRRANWFRSGYMLVSYGEVMLGGGAQAHWGAGPGEELRTSYPLLNLQPSQDAWYADSGTPSFVDDPGVYLTVYAISVPQCPDGYGGCLTRGLYWWNGPHGGGYQGSTIPQPDQGWATTSIGGQAQLDPASPYLYLRFLTSMIPETGFARGSATVWSKDHEYAQSGWSVAYSLVIARQWW